MAVMRRENVVEIIRQQRVIGIIRCTTAGEAVRHGQTLLAAGLRAVEVSLTTPGAEDAIRTLAAEAPAGTVLGAGTVLDSPSARRCLEAGAAFLVAPTLADQVVATAHARDAAAIPGVLTPNEMLAAHTAGADLIKVFPASAISPAALRDILQALPGLPLVPTGGITAATAPDWLAAGAVAVGMGGGLASGTPDQIRETLAALA
jgi:2-dehydro-3-deoxyphosphogluconate aldolase/(4S)-4-hydroxy-2-oxoglutarate aldolase